MNYVFEKAFIIVFTYFAEEQTCFLNEVIVTHTFTSG